VSSAHAVAGDVATAPPMPSATARTPARPTCLNERELIGYNDGFMPTPKARPRSAPDPVPPPPTGVFSLDSDHRRDGRIPTRPPTRSARKGLQSDQRSLGAKTSRDVPPTGHGKSIWQINAICSEWSRSGVLSLSDEYGK
jgi:hypothetical protein